MPSCFVSLEKRISVLRCFLIQAVIYVRKFIDYPMESSWFAVTLIQLKLI